MTFLHDLRADRKNETDGKVKRGISAASFNYYLGSLKSYCRWMIKDRRATESPNGSPTSASRSFG